MPILPHAPLHLSKAAIFIDIFYNFRTKPVFNSMQELAANKINYGIKISKSKFGAALAAHSQMQQNSGGSSPDSIRHMQGRPGGCNGLHSTTATNRLV